MQGARLSSNESYCRTFAIVGLLLHYDYYWFFGLEWEIFHVSMQNVGTFFFYVALFLALWSGLDYLFKFFKVVAR